MGWTTARPTVDMVARVAEHTALTGVLETSRPLKIFGEIKTQKA